MKLSNEQIEERLSTLINWEINEKGEIEKEFIFDSYLSGIDFSGKVGNEAENKAHHPEITIQFKKVIIRSKTHDSDGLTEKDFSLAHAVERLYDY
ncbi:4a-hydroxytetrahydrobiopterin dehydratase [Jeotgalibacillus sp. S-D1]|uniref:4a-hydroxytetrahydrobiopterin dehydratase n=1 Tax=Jeotgalibacillus sp. S-D1 TaxID=2552189 RepID=UPI00140452C4|nr:4a-hydroxytetrahydrobiopterin dehydratase [Jeotgalibacillus sp. S-D1]